MQPRKAVPWMRLAHVLLTLACVAGIWAVVPAQASPIYRYPGTMCRSNGYAGNDTDWDPINWANSLRNRSGSDKTVMCPMITRQDGHAYLEQVSFAVTDSAGGSCRMYRRFHNDMTGGWWSPTDQGQAPNNRDDHFSWYTPGKVYDCTNYVCSLYCTLPTGVTIEGYQWSAP